MCYSVDQLLVFLLNKTLKPFWNICANSYRNFDQYEGSEKKTNKAVRMNSRKLKEKKKDRMEDERDEN